MHNPQGDIDDNSNPFALSISDLMSALLLIFVLLLASTLLKLQQENDTRVSIATEYTDIKEDLYNNLLIEFKDDLKKWNAELSKKDLSIRFKEPDVLFQKNKDEVKPLFSSIISDFFPRYIRVLSKEDFKVTIEEIRIEGHTDSDGPSKGREPAYDYIYNMELSQNRTRNVLKIALSSLNNGFDLDWVRKVLTANGLSSSKPIYFEGKDFEDKRLSRRVEFRVRTNAEERIQQLLEQNQKI